MKKTTPRDLQVRHRLSGAELLGLTGRRRPSPSTLAVDVSPTAGDLPARIPLGNGLYFQPFTATGEEPEE